jgi:methenyltetrahydromethanopterin cyclohydrolase
MDQFGYIAHRTEEKIEIVTVVVIIHTSAVNNSVQLSAKLTKRFFYRTLQISDFSKIVLF